MLILDSAANGHEEREDCVNLRRFCTTRKGRAARSKVLRKGI